MSSNRSWMQRRFDERNNITDEYKNDVKEFIDFAIKRKDTHDDPTLSPASQRKKNILIALHARDPKKGKFFKRPRHTIYELLGYEEAALWTSLSTPARIPEHAYEMMGRALNEVTDMVQAMDGIEEVPRSRLDEELQKLADGAYPSKDDPTQRVLWDQYFKIATNLTASLFGRFKKVVVEDTEVHDEGNRDRNDISPSGLWHCVD
ncbi:hypothetical protein POM88_037265 [Heracleum sosnowskyi]|uniref:Uncharacterized protein n=1 Tax=Heracleum sosnowskyi TaxID=360622 RepID=A0AAD8HRK9_9APIA|nr:hypothetical protein POM88_037265 [Heracleum sosnowskyi]